MTKKKSFITIRTLLTLIAVFITVFLLFKVTIYRADAESTTSVEVTDETTKEVTTTVKNASTTTAKKKVTTTTTAAPKPKTQYYDVPLSEDLQNYIFKLCKKYNIDPKLVISMIHLESNYKASAMGDNGNSYGLMQIQKRYHTTRMDELGCDDLLDPYQNVKVGIDFLAELYSTGKGTKWVLMAYNGGPSYANTNTKNGKISTYAKTVLAYKDEINPKK